MKKINSIMLVTALTAVLFTGCNSTQTSQKSNVEVAKTGLPVVKEKITLTMFGRKSPMNGEFKDLKLFKKMEEWTNISLEFITPAADSVIEKRNLAFASKSLPDFFYAVPFSPAEEIQYGSQKQLAPLDEYIEDYAPNLKKVLTDYPYLRKYMTAPDGHIYGLTAINLREGRDTTDNFYINKDWLDTLGLSMPTTPDELYKVYKAFKTGDPNKNGKADEVPLSLSNSAHFNNIASFFGITPIPNGIYNDNGKVIYAYTDNRYKEMLRFMNKLYKEELLDSESFGQKDAQLIAKGNEPDVILGSFFHAAPFVVVPMEKATQYTNLPALTAPDGSKTWAKRGPVREASYFAMTTANKYPEATMRWVDLFYSIDSGFVNNGFEGEDYEMGPDGYYVRIYPKDKFDNFGIYRGQVITPAPGNGIPMISWPADVGKQMKWEDTDMYNMYDKMTLDAYASVWKESYPKVYFDNEQSTDINNITVNINSYFDNMRAKFIVGEANIDAEWDKYCDAIKKMGSDKLVEYHQKALDAISAN